MATSTGQMTVAQYLAVPEQFDANGNDVISELIAGEIVLAPLPSRRHDRLKNRICKVLTSFLEANPRVALEANVQIGCAITDVDVFVPDVCVVTRVRLDADDARVLTGAPEIAIEVVSPSDTAIRLKHKVDTYLENGSHSVWVVYPENRSIELHTANGTREFKAEQHIEDATLPGFSHPASNFF